MLGRQHRTVAGRGTTELTDAVVVERVRAVAKLVSSETTVRDVVVYRNRWLGSTKRSIIVATGVVEAGIALDSTVRAHIDPATRTVAIVIPHARVLDVSVTRLETYDESSGLWNPFRPSDRDSIFQHVRGQLGHTAESLDVAARADSSAVRLLQALLGTDGYAVHVSFAMPAPVLAPD
ncbi:MAG TPA: DUF4230 domain-containing protein [Gemmatimonadaceae bacterium]|nr:DUF4230 domain-containing protein [Gemmatimonadaceae bacterium]